MRKLIKTHAAKFLCAFLIISGCTRINNDSDQLALDCGISRQQAQNNTYLKISADSMASYDETSSLFLSARFQDSETKETEGLSVTRRGCVRLPERAGRILVSNKQQKMSAVYNHSPSFWSRSNPIVKIQSSPSIKAKTLCPEDGIFGNRQIQSPFQFETQGSLEPVRLRIFVSNAVSKLETNLYVKDFSETLKGFPENTDVQNLSEGIYYLRAGVTDYGEGFDVGEKLLISDTACKLVILRQEPRVEGLNQTTDPTARVLSRGDKVPWTSSSPDETLFICKEPYESKSLCKPTSECQSANNFRAQTRVDVERPGIFNFFILSKDKAGNQSSMICETVVVSEQSPNLDLRWLRQDWNTDGGEAMDLPYASIEAQAFLRHPQIDPKDLERTLECKVDFLIQGRTPLKGKDVVCGSGRCVGRNLEEFTPCSPQVQIDLRKIWQQKSVAVSQLRLTMRADDSAGHKVEKTISVWINSSKWPLSPLKEVATIQGQEPWLTFHDNFDQLLMKSTYSKPFLVKDDNWKETQVDADQDLKLWQIQQGSNGEIYAEAYLDAATVAFNGIFHWTGKLWQKERHTNVCRRLYPARKSEVFCGTVASQGEISTISQLGVWRDGGWKMFDTPTVLNIGSERVLEDHGGRVWIFASGQAYYRKVEDPTWKKLVIEDFSDYFADKDGNVWLYIPSLTGNSNYFLKSNGGQFEKIQQPPATQYFRDKPRLSPDGRMTFGAYAWDQSSKSWQAMEFPKKFESTKSDYYPLFDNRGQVWWFDEYGLMGYLNQNYVYIPLNLTGLSCFDESSECGIAITGEKTLTLSALKTSGFHYETFTLKPEPLIIFDMESLGMPPTKDITKTWTNRDGSIEIQFGYAQAPTFRLDNGHWVPGSTFKFPAGSFSHRMPDGRWLFSDRFGLHLQSGDSWETIFDPNSQNFYGVIERLWNLENTTLFRLGSTGSLYRIDGNLVTRLNSPDNKRFFMLGGSLWGINEDGFVRYKNLNFDIDVVYSSTLLGEDVLNVFETAEYEVLVYDGHTDPYLLALSENGTRLKIDFPSRFSEQIRDAARLGPGQYAVLLSNGIYEVDKGIWKILVSSEDLSKMGYMPGIYGMVSDAEKRLWFYQAGLLFRYDWNRPSISFY